MPVRGNQVFAYSHHKRLVEEMLADYRSRHPALEQVVLRIGTILGANVRNQITDLFEKPRLLAIAGSDSPFVFIWDQDVVAIIVRPFARRAGRHLQRGRRRRARPSTKSPRAWASAALSCPPWLLKGALAVLKPLGLTQYGPEQLDFLRYRPVLLNTRLKRVRLHPALHLVRGVRDLPESSDGQGGTQRDRVTSEASKDSEMKPLLSPAACALPLGTVLPGCTGLDAAGPRRRQQAPGPGHGDAGAPTRRRHRHLGSTAIPHPASCSRALFEVTRFTDAKGQAVLPDSARPFRLRLRKPGFKLLAVESGDLGAKPVLTLVAETDSGPWPSSGRPMPGRSTLGKTLTDEAVRKEFVLQCGFCHQQGGAFLRRDRSAAEWSTVIQRMVRYGARLSSQAKRRLPALLEAHWKKINANPALVPDGTPWAPDSGRHADPRVGDWRPVLADARPPAAQQRPGLRRRQPAGPRLRDRSGHRRTTPSTRSRRSRGDKLGGLLTGRLREFPNTDLPGHPFAGRIAQGRATSSSRRRTSGG